MYSKSPIMIFVPLLLHFFVHIIYSILCPLGVSRHHLKQVQLKEQIAETSPVVYCILNISMLHDRYIMKPISAFLYLH